MTKTTCFSRDELRHYLLGDLPENASMEVASHVDECVECEATVAQLDSVSDTLIQSLREPVVPDEPASVYRLAARRAVAVWQELSAESDPADFGDGVSGDGGSGDHVTEVVQLRDYELLESLARGGMGTVYRARHTRLNRQVAVKVLPGRWLRDPAVIARFEREMQAVGSLRHAAIVQATDGGEVDGVHFLVMELIDGLDGGALVQHLGPLPVADACEIACQAAVGMAYVHQRGIIHRDLKPSNLMVTRTGEVKVLDLGLARVVGDQLAEDELTTVGQLMGTLDFMSPEQLENSHEADDRADVYSLGATLYKLLAGVPPHTTEPREPVLSKLRRIASHPPTPLQESRPDAPAELCELVDRMLRQNADDRPASMEVVADSLRAFTESSDLKRRIKDAENLRKQRKRSGRSASEPLLSGLAALDGRGTQSELLTRPARGSRWRTWLSIALLLLTGALGVIITLQTTAGQLVIETATPDVEVRILKAGQPYRQFTIKQNAESLRLGAGEYEIEIVSDADGLEIENGSYTLKRGETWLAKIAHRADSGNAQDAADPSVQPRYLIVPEALGGEPTYEGKTLNQWITLLRQERSPKQLHEACQALEKLAVGDDTQEAVAAVLAATRFQEMYSSYKDESGQSIRIGDTVKQFLATRDQAVVVAELTRSLEQSEKGNIDFALDYLNENSDFLRPLASERLIAHVERLVGDERTQIRSQALGLLQKIGSPEVATRRLVVALSDRDPDIRLLAARMLIQMKSNAPLVVAALRDLVRSGELRCRAEAAWRLGDLGVAARPALPELTAIVEDDDIAVSKQAAYMVSQHTTSIYGGSMCSVKDAAIRAMAKIGDESVEPVLVAEWMFRESGDNRRKKSVPAWNKAQGQMVANTYNADWVADAIEQLIGMRPHLGPRDEGPVAVWSTGGVTFEALFQIAFKQLRGRSTDEIFDAAERLMERAHDFQKISAIKSAGKASVPAFYDYKLEIKLFELLVASDGPTLVLESMISRWSSYTTHRPADEPEKQTAAVAAYRNRVVRMVREAEDRQAIVAHLLALVDRGQWPAGDVLIEVLPELEPALQVEAIGHVAQAVAKSLAVSYPSSKDWLNPPARRELLRQYLRQASDDAWERLVFVLLQRGMAMDDVKQSIETRFGDDSIDRRNLLRRLIRLHRDDPELTQLIIDLIEHPALDAPAAVWETAQGRKEHSLRADRILVELHSVSEQRRHLFLPLLQRLAESGKNGEAEMARNLLDAWK